MNKLKHKIYELEDIYYFNEERELNLLAKNGRIESALFMQKEILSKEIDIPISLVKYIFEYYITYAVINRTSLSIEMKLNQTTNEKFDKIYSNLEDDYYYNTTLKEYLGYYGEVIESVIEETLQSYGISKFHVSIYKSKIRISVGKYKGYAYLFDIFKTFFKYENVNIVDDDIVGHDYLKSIENKYDLEYKPIVLNMRKLIVY